MRGGCRNLCEIPGRLLGRRLTHVRNGADGDNSSMYLKKVEVAIRECVPVSTVLDWIDDGLEVHEGPSGEELIDAEELADYLASLRNDSMDSSDSEDVCDCVEGDCDCNEEEE